MSRADGRRRKRERKMAAQGQAEGVARTDCPSVAAGSAAAQAAGQPAAELIRDYPHSDGWKSAFLRVFCKIGNITDAAEKVGVHRKTVEAARKSDPLFKIAFDDARREADDRIELIAMRRAFKGVARKKFTGKGEPIIDPATGEQYVEREYSDMLMALILRARIKRYRNRQEITHGGEMENTVHVDFGVTAEQRESAQRAIAARFGGRLLATDANGQSNGHGPALG